MRIFRMEPAEGKVPVFLPGQFAFIHLLDAEGNTIVKRPYSIASAPSAPYLEFCIEMRGGEMTGRLEKVNEGDVVGIDSPYGHMAYRGETRAAFICGGTGIAPFMSVLRHAAEESLQGAFILFYSVRSEDRILYRDELEALQKRNSGIKAVITITREVPPGWKGECGRLSEAILKKHAGSPDGFDWFICGSPEMVKGVKECLAALKVDLKRLRIEGWG